jgi:hypothetical protein
MQSRCIRIAQLIGKLRLVVFSSGSILLSRKFLCRRQALDGTVEIKEGHIESWKSNPAALFQVTPFQGLDDVPRYALGSWE